MADTLTPNFGWTKPDPGGDANTWGSILNGTLDKIDAQVRVNSTAITALQGIASANSIILNAAAGTQKAIVAQSGSVARWNMRLATSEAEVGSDSGSNFYLDAYHDSGTYFGSPLSISRANLAATFSNNLAVGGALNVTGNFFVSGNAGGPYANFTNMNVTNITASNNMQTANLTVTSGITCNANLSIGSGSGLYSPYANITNVNVGGLTASGNIATSGSSTVSTASGDIDSGHDLNAANNITINNLAFKPGGGPWNAISDARIKTVTGPYEPGLAEAIQLRPVVYTYKGNAGPAHQAAAASGKSFVGLVADEIMQVLPGMVEIGKGTIDGVEVDDLKTLDLGPLVFVLLNAVKELKAEVDALKAAAP